MLRSRLAINYEPLLNLNEKNRLRETFQRSVGCWVLSFAVVLKPAVLKGQLHTRLHRLRALTTCFL